MLQNLSQACFAPRASFLLLMQFLAYCCPLAFPSLGDTRSLFFSLPQLLICQSFSPWWLCLASPSKVLSCRASPSLQHLAAPLLGTLSQPTQLSLERQVESRPLQHFSGCQHVLEIVHRKPSGSFRTSAPGPAFAGWNGGLSELEGIDVQQSRAGAPRTVRCGCEHVVPVWWLLSYPGSIRQVLGKAVW